MDDYFKDEVNYKHFCRTINSWDGTPYRHLTIVKGRGADCALFIGGILKDIGIIQKIVYDYYPSDWFIHTDYEYVLDAFTNHVKEQARSNIVLAKYKKGEVELFRGDILCFRMSETKTSNHAAYYLEGEEIVHSLNGIGVHKIRMPEFFKDRLTTIFRLMEK